MTELPIPVVAAALNEVHNAKKFQCRDRKRMIHWICAVAANTVRAV